MADYVDRYQDFKNLKNAIDHDVSIIFLLSGKAVGITSFLKEKIKPAYSNNTVFFYDAKIYNNLAEGLLNNVIGDIGFYDTLQRCMDSSYGEKGNSTVLQDVPYFGNTLSYFFSSKKSLPLYTGNYASAIESILIAFFQELNSKSIILIDNAQYINEESYATIVDIIKYTDTCIVCAITEKTENYLKHKNYCLERSIVLDEIVFSDPHIELVKELSVLYGFNLSTEQAYDVLERCKNNIHEIISSIITPSNNYKLDLFSQSIITLLWLLKRVTKNDALELLKKCNLYSPDFNSTYKKTICELKQCSIITEDVNNYELCATNHPEVIKCSKQVANLLYYKSVVLSFYKEKKNLFNYPKSTIEALFCIAKDLMDPSSTLFARMLVKRALQEGTVVENSFFCSSCFDVNNENDCIIVSIVLTRKREYSEALKWLSYVQPKNAYLLAFYGILLNRVRKHQDAEKYLYKALNEITDIEIKVLIYSYLVSNYIHQEKISMAQEVSIRAVEECANAQNIGYLLRNAASAFSDNRNEWYDRALQSFKKKQDDFGYYTTMCNKGYAILYDSVKEGLDYLNKSLEQINQFGENNSHIALNDLGLAYMLNEQYEEAINCFSIVIATESNEMPQIFSKINLACCKMIIGNTTEGVIDINNIEKEVLLHPLDRVRQKYYINRLFIEYSSKANISKNTIEKAEQYLDRYDPSKTKRLIMFYKQYITHKHTGIPHNWKDLFSPCGLVYWFINPLKVFPEGFLDQIMPE